MVKINSIGYIALNTASIEKLTHYYHEVIGLHVTDQDKDGTTYFCCSSDHHHLVLYPSDIKGIRHIGLRISPEINLEEARYALQKSGVKATIIDNPELGLKQALEIDDPDGLKIRLYAEMEPSNADYVTSGIRPVKFAHVALCVQDAKRSVRFYEEQLALKVSDWLQDFLAFMRCRVDHHILTFCTMGEARMAHMAFELEDWAHIKTACDLLAKHRVPIIWGPGRHGIGHNLFTYHRDPDGNTVELFAEMDRILDEESGLFEARPWHEDNRQGPKVWESPEFAASPWGILPPPDFLTKQ
jgi:catechol-2,3-dioxygenase